MKQYLQSTSIQYIIGKVSTSLGYIPRISGKLNMKDRLGTIMVRLSVNRDNYCVLPGLYAIGNPGELSDVHKGLSARGFYFAERQGTYYQARLLYGMRSLFDELSYAGNNRKIGCRLCCRYY